MSSTSTALTKVVDTIYHYSYLRHGSCIGTNTFSLDVADVEQLPAWWKPENLACSSGFCRAYSEVGAVLAEEIAAGWKRWMHM